MEQTRNRFVGSRLCRPTQAAEAVADIIQEVEGASRHPVTLETVNTTALHRFRVLVTVVMRTASTTLPEE